MKMGTKIVLFLSKKKGSFQCSLPGKKKMLKKIRNLNFKRKD